METLEYSIVYASIRPEIKERISVGIIFCQGGEIEVRYSNVKLNAVKSLLPKIEYNSLRSSVISMAAKNTLDSVSQIDYLNRYSNNLLTVSELRSVRLGDSALSKNKLYKMYVYNRGS